MLYQSSQHLLPTALTYEQQHDGAENHLNPARLRGQPGLWTLVAEYSDIASGNDDRRPGFQAALACCRQRGAVLVAHRLMLEVRQLQAKGVLGQAAIARALTERRAPTPSGRGA